MKANHYAVTLRYGVNQRSITRSYHRAERPDLALEYARRYLGVLDASCERMDIEVDGRWLDLNGDGESCTGLADRFTLRGEG